MALISWPEIEGFHNIRKFTQTHPEILGENTVVSYRCKVKLHGTNAAVQCHSSDEIVVQSRTAIVTPDNDNAGFARWVKETEESWKAKSRQDTIIYGEWIGPGIQKGVAVSNIPKKVFAVFAARPMANGEVANDYLWVEPETLRDIVRGVPDTYVLPWHKDQIDINWLASAEELTKITEHINEWVMAIEANDPWVEDVFGIKGTGEGLVFYPRSSGHSHMNSFTNLVFKAKGEKHKNIKTAAPAQIDAQSAANVSQFVDMVLTQARLEQGATAIAGSLTFDMKLVGKFIGWICSDVEKETQDELAASNLTWKQVQKQVGDKARMWYIEQAKKQ